MANVVGSFAQGFGLGNRMYDRANQTEDRERRLKREEKAEKRSDLLFKQSQEDRTQGLADAEEKRKRNKVLQGREDEQYKRNKVIQSRQDAEYNHQVALRDRQEGYNNIFLPAVDLAISSGDFSAMETPEFQEYVRKNPQFDLGRIMSDDMGQNLGYAANTLRAAANNEFPAMDDPKLLNAVNTIFPEIVNAETLPKVYTDENGEQHQITNREVSRVIPAEDGKGFIIEQSLTLENGKQVQVPVTQGRTSNQDDPVMVVPMQELTNRMDTMMRTRSQLKQTQLNDWRYLQEGRGLNAGANGGLTSTAKRGKGGKGGQPNDQKYTKEFLASNGKISEQYDKAIQEVRMNNMLEPEERDQQIRDLENQRDERLGQNSRMYGQFTDVGNPNLEANRKTYQINQLTTSVINQYNGYDFSNSDRQLIAEAIESGKSPEQIENWINSQIKNGGIQQSKSGNKTQDDDDLVSSFRADQQGSQQTQNQQQAEGQTAESGEQAGPQSLDDVVIDPNIDIKEKLRLIRESGLPEEEQQRLRERANYGAAYRAGEAISDTANKVGNAANEAGGAIKEQYVENELPLNNFKNRGFQYGLGDAGRG